MVHIDKMEEIVKYMSAENPIYLCILGTIGSIKELIFPIREYEAIHEIREEVKYRMYEDPYMYTANTYKKKLKEKTIKKFAGRYPRKIPTCREVEYGGVRYSVIEYKYLHPAYYIIQHYFFNFIPIDVELPTIHHILSVRDIVTNDMLANTANVEVLKKRQYVMPLLKRPKDDLYLCMIFGAFPSSGDRNMFVLLNHEETISEDFPNRTGINIADAYSVIVG